MPNQYTPPRFQESLLIVSSDHPTSLLIDIHTGQTIQSFKPCKTISTNTVTPLSFSSTHFAALQKDKNIISIFAQDRDQPWMQCPVPEKLTCLCASRNGRLLAAGSWSGKLYVWDIPSGHMLAVVDAHFQKVTCIAFSLDDRLIATGSADASIKVFETSSLVSKESIDRATMIPLYTLSSHTLEISNLTFTKSLSCTSKLISGSHDQTVRVHDMLTGKTQVTIVFPSPVLTLALDALDNQVFVGSSGGRVYSTHLVGDVYTSHEIRTCLTCLDGDVLQLVCSSCCTYLIAGTSNGLVQVLDPSTGTHLRSLPVPLIGGPIVYLHIYTVPVVDVTSSFASSSIHVPLIASLARSSSGHVLDLVSDTPLILPPSHGTTDPEFPDLVDNYLDSVSMNVDPIHLFDQMYAYSG